MEFHLAINVQIYGLKKRLLPECRSPCLANAWPMWQKARTCSSTQFSPDRIAPTHREEH